MRQRRNTWHVLLRAFDLLELDGKDLRREPLERRKVLLMRLVARARIGLEVNDHIAEAGDVVFCHACQLGFEGIVWFALQAAFSAAWTLPPPALRMPTIYLFPACCARAASGHAAAPPSSVMKSRRFMQRSR